MGGAAVLLKWGCDFSSLTRASPFVHLIFVSVFECDVCVCVCVFYSCSFVPFLAISIYSFGKTCRCLMLLPALVLVSVC